MSVPGIVQSTLDGEEIAARVSLGGEDELFITSSSSIIYRAEGLLSDESIDEFPHDADRITLSEGRRKTKFTLEYPLDGAREFTIPASKTDAVLHPVLAGVLNGNGITDPGETVVQTYRFSELTLIVTSDRLVKHIGGAVWDDDYEEYHFGDVTNLAFEDGSVATQIVLTADGRPQRIKAPNEEANDLRERLERALFDYHDVESLAELNEGGDGADDADEATTGTVDFGEGVDPLDANPPEPDDHDGGEPTTGASETRDPLEDDGATFGGTDAATAQSARDGDSASRTSSRDESESRARDEVETVETENLFEAASEEASAGTVAEATEAGAAPSGAETGTRTDTGASAEPAPELLERLDDLEQAVERQSDRIEAQQRTIEQLIAELRQGR